jgi:hypothetical protein
MKKNTKNLILNKDRIKQISETNLDKIVGASYAHPCTGDTCTCPVPRMI